MQKNYQTQNIVYALFIGNPNPDNGDLAMGLMDGELATDFVFADCSQVVSKFDSSNFDAKKGFDGVWDIIVGRIPYYGEKSEFSKASHVDEILKKTVAYEKASPEQILERYNFAVDGYTVDAHLVEFAGFPYITDAELAKSYLSQDYFPKKNRHFTEDNHVPFVKFKEGDESSVEWHRSKDLAPDHLNIVAINDQAQSADPRNPKNSSYLHLCYGAIASVGSTAKVEDNKDNAKAIQPQSFYNIYRTLMMSPYSIGQAYWANNNKGQNKPSSKAIAQVLYGDPSVTPFPEALFARRSGTVRPIHNLEFYEPTKIDHLVKLQTQEYDIQNLSSEMQNYSAELDVPWLEIKGQAQGQIQSMKVATLTVAFNKKARDLSAGTHVAKVKFTMAGEVFERQLIFKRYKEDIEFNETYKNSETKSLSLVGNTVNIIEKGKLPENIDRTLSFNLKANSLADVKSLLKGQGVELNLNQETKALELNCKPYEFGEKADEKPYISFSKSTKNLVKLKGETPVKEGVWSSIAISFSYSTKVVNLYLNGKIEASAKLPSYYFCLDGLNTGEGLTAELDDFQVKRGASSLKDIQSLATLAKKK